jgi:hypothetical protein
MLHKMIGALVALRTETMMGYANYYTPAEHLAEAKKHLPHIVTLCGSTRFKDEINRVNAELTLEGKLVISLGVFGHTDMPDHDWTTNGSALKAQLDELHKRKIDLADEVYVVNPGGYIGESTRGEIAYAEAHGKPVRYLAEVRPGAASGGEEPTP